MVKSIGKCSTCVNEESKLTPVKMVTGSFCGELRTVDKCLCYDCLKREFFYVDLNGTVKFNTVKTETTSSIGG